MGYCARCIFPHVKRRGNLTIVYSCKENDEFDKVKDIYGDSIDGVITDNPSVFADWYMTE